ncbi:MAG: response regulator receiver protein [Candidatus Solibacter sp.]|nr:response regulator receiver protein [Candidatus Solibacter sp.]
MPRILVADDDPIQLDLRRTVLEMNGYQVDTALSVASTLRLIQANPTDLVILDLRFPNDAGEADPEEGMALIRRLRELAFTGPIIVLSGWPEELYGRPEESMISRILLKPVKIQMLLDTVRALLTSPGGTPSDTRP